MNIMFFLKVALAMQPLDSKFAISYCMGCNRILHWQKEKAGLSLLL